MHQLAPYFKEAIALSLSEELNKARTTNEYLQEVREKVSDLLGANGAFGSKLTSREQRLVSYFFNPFLMAFFMLDKIEIKTEQQKIESLNRHHDRLFEKREPLAIAASAASTIIAAITPTVMPAIALGLVAGGATTLLARKFIGQPSPTDSALQENSITVNTSISPNDIRSTLEIAVLNFDKLSSEIEDIRSEALKENLQRPSMIEDVPNILPFLQDMLGLEQELTELENFTPDCIADIKQSVKIIPKILISNGIDLVSYQPGVNEDLFERQSAFGAHIDGPRQIKPALVRGEITLIKGVVVHL